MMDKSPGLFKLMRTHDMSLANRVNDFIQSWKDRNNEMTNCRNKIQEIALHKWDTCNRLGLNQYFDDTVTKEDLLLFNVAMQFNITSFYNAFQWPRVLDNMRSIQGFIEEESRPVKACAFLGLMNLWSVKDHLLLNHPEFWINKKVDESLERDGTIMEVESKSVPVCDVDGIQKIHDRMVKNQYKYDLNSD